jgi:hypothetical protein
MAAGMASLEWLARICATRCEHIATAASSPKIGQCPVKCSFWDYVLLHIVMQGVAPDVPSAFVNDHEAAKSDTATNADPQEALTVKWETSDTNIATFDVQVFDVATGGIAVRTCLCSRTRSAVEYAQLPMQHQCTCCSLVGC